MLKPFFEVALRMREYRTRLATNEQIRKAFGEVKKRSTGASSGLDASTAGLSLSLCAAAMPAACSHPEADGSRCAAADFDKSAYTFTLGETAPAKSQMERHDTTRARDRGSLKVDSLMA